MAAKTRPPAVTLMFGSTAFALAAMLAGCTTATGEPEQTSAPTPTSAVDYQQQANDNWWDLWMFDYPDAVKPEVEVVRESTWADWSFALADCMTAAGYPDTDPGPDGGIGITHAPEGQREAQLIALYTCHAQYPLAEKYLRPFTPKQFGELYDYWTGDLADCLAGKGFISTEKAPSRETYVQENDDLSWNPFNGMYDALGEEQYNAVAAECPRYPEFIY